MLYFIIAGLVVVCDQLLKYFIVSNVELGGHMDLIPGIIGLTNIRNTGAAFSILEGMQWLLLLITAVCVVFLIVYILKTKLGVTGRLALAFILGGAIGNAIDRIAFGYVVDMFELEFINYAIFNIADCFIVCGDILFFLCYIIHIFKTEHAQKRMPELDRLLAAKEKEQAEQENTPPLDAGGESGQKAVGHTENALKTGSQEAAGREEASSSPSCFEEEKAFPPTETDEEQKP